MAKTKESNNGLLEKLAIIADQTQSLFKGKATVVFELEKDEYYKTISMFRDIDKNHKQFKIDISGTDLIFILIENE